MPVCPILRVAGTKGLDMHLRLAAQSAETVRLSVDPMDGQTVLWVVPGLIDGRAFAALGAVLERLDHRGKDLNDSIQLGLGDLIEHVVGRLPKLRRSRSVITDDHAHGAGYGLLNDTERQARDTG